MSILFASGPVAAQRAASRGELFAGAGIARVGGDESSLGNGPHFFGGVGFRLSTRVAVEVNAMTARHERDIGGPLEGTATGVLGSVVYHFTDGRTQPFAMGSAGLLRSETTHTYTFLGEPTTFRTDETHFAGGGGGGVKIFLTPRFSLRPEVRIIFSEATGVLGLVAASIGIGYHW